ncbi:hypothetical protein KAT92_03045 [Candidatus Babeliales bacterium]|nr:hypothetical protein [Candidatus Babeliales bacterium]
MKTLFKNLLFILCVAGFSSAGLNAEPSDAEKYAVHSLRDMIGNPAEAQNILSCYANPGSALEKSEELVNSLAELAKQLNPNPGEISKTKVNFAVILKSFDETHFGNKGDFAGKFEHLQAKVVELRKQHDSEFANRIAKS